MNTLRQTCGNCCGLGKRRIWVDTGDGYTLEAKETVCDACDGDGYTEYAIFSVEEAKAILKHCGLDEE